MSDNDLPKIVQARFAAWRVMRGDSEGNFTGESPDEQRYMSKHWPTESGAIPATDAVDADGKTLTLDTGEEIVGYVLRGEGGDLEIVARAGEEWEPREIATSKEVVTREELHRDYELHPARASTHPEQSVDQMVLHAINLYGDETLHKALDAIGWPASPTPTEQGEDA